jgi:hypothetical protein
MGFLTGLLWLAAVIIAAMASGWVFRAVAIALSAPMGWRRNSAPCRSRRGSGC